MTTLVSLLIFGSFALLGRWLQLHPEKVFPEGAFISENTTWAKLARAELAVVGIFAVMFGTAFALYSLLELGTFGHWILKLLAIFIAGAAGIVAARRVRTEVKSRPQYQIKNPHGWWP